MPSIATGHSHINLFAFKRQSIPPAGLYKGSVGSFGSTGPDHRVWWPQESRHLLGRF